MFNELLQVGVDILKTTVSSKTKSILCQIGDVINQESVAENVEWWQHVGFSSRPPKPDAGKKACQGVIVRRGDHDVCIASKDERGADIEDVNDGETLVYAPGVSGAGKARVFLQSDGTITIKNASGSVTVLPSGDITIKGKNATVDALSAEFDAATVKIGKAPATGILTLQSGAPMFAALSVWMTSVTAAVQALVPVTGILDPSGTLQSAPAAALTAFASLPSSPSTYTTTVKAGP